MLAASARLDGRGSAFFGEAASVRMRRLYGRRRGLGGGGVGDIFGGASERSAGPSVGHRLQITCTHGAAGMCAMVGISADFCVGSIQIHVQYGSSMRERATAALPVCRPASGAPVRAASRAPRGCVPLRTGTWRLPKGMKCLRMTSEVAPEVRATWAWRWERGVSARLDAFLGGWACLAPFSGVCVVSHGASGHCAAVGSAGRKCAA